MPLYNHILNWNGLDVQIYPSETWRKRIPFWPYFVGQRIRLEVHVTKTEIFEQGDLQFHAVEKLAGEAKPRIVPLSLESGPASDQKMVFSLENAGIITGGGEVKYWLSNRGYNVDHQPIFTADVINPDTFVIPFIFMVLGPLLGFLSGLVLGLVVGS